MKLRRARAVLVARCLSPAHLRGPAAPSRECAVRPPPLVGSGARARQPVHVSGKCPDFRSTQVPARAPYGGSRSSSSL